MYEPLFYQRVFLFQKPQAGGGPTVDQMAPAFVQQRGAVSLGAVYA
jgi:hypothetical protein